MSVYAFSDLHSQYDLWEQIKEYIKPEDIVFCLGDCVDRGKVGLDILIEVLNTPNITLLRGNHEDFIINIGSEMIYMDPNEDIESMYWEIPNISLWEQNGAKKTIKDFKRLSKTEKLWLVNKIKKLPTHIEYTNVNGDIIYLCHAGRQPDTIEVKDTHMGDIPMNNYLWDRYHLTQPHWRGKDNEYCVHGHTPIKYMHYYIDTNNNPSIVENQIYRYCENHKINIDLGSFDTHYACLLNLDTFEPIYFKDRTIFKKN